MAEADSDIAGPGSGEELVTDSELAQMLEELDRAAPRRGVPVEAQLVRELTPDDLVGLLPVETEPTGSAGIISRIRHSHHQIARLLAEGRKAVEVSAMLGYSPSWISSLQRDPAFRELLTYYSAERDEILLDLAERQKNLGAAALEELAERLESDPESFANRELMELVDSNVNRPRQTGNGSGGGAVLPAVNISFVTPEPKALPPRAEAAAVIEGEVLPEALPDA